MQNILDELIRQTTAGHRAALCVVVGSRGSTPQEKGAKMLVLPDGRLVGTLGGGCVEAEVRRQALELISTDQSRLLEFRLDHDYGWDDGLICGGVMEIAVQIFDRTRINEIMMLRDALIAGRGGTLRLTYQQNEAARHYTEDIGPAPSLVIAGAGHVGMALARIAADLDFRVTVIDDRADLVSEARFPVAERISGDIEQELRRFPIQTDTYIVIVTRGHRNDGQALHAVAHSQAKYIGLIGSKAKIKTIFDDLLQKGVDADSLLQVHAPIGYEIGAVTVPEIAVSIAAELVAVRRGRADQPARPMKLDVSEMRNWLSRSRV